MVLAELMGGVAVSGVRFVICVCGVCGSSGRIGKYLAVLWLPVEDIVPG